MRSIPQHCTSTTKKQKNCGIRVGLDVFGSVSMLGCGSSLVGGRVLFGSLLFRADQTNT